MGFEFSGDELVKKARETAEEAPRGQTDRVGQPYIEHSRPVAPTASRRRRPRRPPCPHDVVEDCGITPDDLMALDMPKDVIDCVVLLTRRDDVPGDDYYRRIASDDVALWSSWPTWPTTQTPTG